MAQLFYLQVFSNQYDDVAKNQSIYRKVVYPSRGLIYDRNKKIILDNTTLYDLVVIPKELKKVDTNLICSILNIDTAEFKKRVIGAIIKNGSYRPTVFQGLLDNKMFAQLSENIVKMQGFDLVARPIRKYPFDAGAHILGYVKEVDTSFLRRHNGEGYSPGDYAGMIGLERTYEKVLMGQRGIEYWQKDKNNRPTKPYENGKLDTIASSGSNMYSSIDVELQELGEKLMENKLGSIVAIDPKTGGILALVSAPNYKPSLLTGKESRKHINELITDPRKPMLNRAIGQTYSPGSTFKTLQALIGMQENVINTSYSVSCGGAFYGCGSGKPMRCLDYGTYNFRSAIKYSDNTYFATVMQKVINNPAYPTIDSSLNVWAHYMNQFGLGHKLGIDIPAEKGGLIPNAAYYDKHLGKGKWNYCSFRSVSIGQGEVNTTPLQVANEMAYLANKGWYKTPHLIDSIDGGDKYGLLNKFKEKHTSVNINDSIFEAVHDGMQGVVESGTGTNAKVKGITICGKTGTVENYGPGGVKRPNHAFFCAFAPRDNPKIAIMCVVENSGRFGGTYAAPIVGLMIEKYINDSIDKGRKSKIEQMAKLNLIPNYIYADYRRQDSINNTGDTAYLISKGYLKLLKDTIGLDEDDIAEDLLKKKEAKKDKPVPTDKQDSIKIKQPGLLPKETIIETEIKKDTSGQ